MGLGVAPWPPGQEVGPRPRFLGHASCSIFLILVNKTISTSFPFARSCESMCPKIEAWTVVALQNTGTILCSGFLHLYGKAARPFSYDSERVSPLFLASTSLNSIDPCIVPSIQWKSGSREEPPSQVILRQLQRHQVLPLLLDAVLLVVDASLPSAAPKSTTTLRCC